VAVLVLDTEALSSLARPDLDHERHNQVRGALRSAHDLNNPVRIPTAVLVELYRGPGFDEPIDRVLGQGFAQVITTGARIARIAGHLLADIEAGSELAIDALVVATTSSSWASEGPRAGAERRHDPVPLAGRFANPQVASAIELLHDLIARDEP